MGSENVSMALDYMLAEAKRWRKASEVMSRACDTTSTLTLTVDDFSGAADNAGLVDVYGQLQHKLYSLIGQGADQFLDTANRLETVVKRSQRSEQEAADRLRRIQHYLEEQGL